MITIMQASRYKVLDLGGNSDNGKYESYVSTIMEEESLPVSQ